MRNRLGIDNIVSSLNNDLISRSIQKITSRWSFFFLFCAVARVSRALSRIGGGISRCVAFAHWYTVRVVAERRGLEVAECDIKTPWFNAAVLVGVLSVGWGKRADSAADCALLCSI
jgi:hypothetical protein